MNKFNNLCETIMEGSQWEWPLGNISYDEAVLMINDGIELFNLTNGWRMKLPTPQGAFKMKSIAEKTAKKLIKDLKLKSENAKKFTRYYK